MSDEAQVWHYGLMAERWAENINEAPELPYFESAIGRFGQPVLDVACGTGRLLLPLLRAGIDIDGCDLSRDMLFHCRRKAEEEGRAARLYEQPMHAFELPRRYRTIYICGSFGLAGSREKDLETLRRCYDHLQAGGALLLDIEAEYHFPKSWNSWLPAERRSLPEAWPEEGSGEVAADGSENIGYFRWLEINPLEQSYRRQVRLEKWVEGEKVAEEEYTLKGNMYFKNEVLLMLQIAGFREVAVYGDYSQEPATAEHKELNFEAIK